MFDQRKTGSKLVFPREAVPAQISFSGQLFDLSQHFVVE
jgi:hypothetical protein